jgi:Leucine-rich repeat (LRR) protein
LTQPLPPLASLSQLLSLSLRKLHLTALPALHADVQLDVMDVSNNDISQVRRSFVKYWRFVLSGRALASCSWLRFPARSRS